MLFPCTIKEQIRRVIERRKTSRTVGNTDYILQRNRRSERGCEFLWRKLLTESGGAARKSCYSGDWGKMTAGSRFAWVTQWNPAHLNSISCCCNTILEVSSLEERGFPAHSSRSWQGRNLKKRIPLYPWSRAESNEQIHTCPVLS